MYVCCVPQSLLLQNIQGLPQDDAAGVVTLMDDRPESKRKDKEPRTHSQPSNVPQAISPDGRYLILDGDIPGATPSPAANLTQGEEDDEESESEA